jgi:hypothetical protein
MRLVFLCVIAWLVLALAALASGGVGDSHAPGGGSGSVIAR